MLLNVHAILWHLLLMWKLVSGVFYYQLTMLRSQHQLVHQQNAHTPFRLQ